MSQFEPFHIVHRRGRTQMIASLSDAKAAASRLQTKDPAGEWAGIAELLEQAGSGHVSPRTAFNAFAKMALTKGIVKKIDKSAAWEDFARHAGLAPQT